MAFRGAPSQPARVQGLQLTALQKARRLNLDSSKYGVFAEIGAGQEIARWFFQAGGAAGTVAKTISAYDMRVSDAIYGRCTRYVCRERLLCMLDYEYALLLKRLKRERGQGDDFFRHRRHRCRPQLHPQR